MPIFFNLNGLVMLGISFGLWMLLALNVPEVGGGVILAVSIFSLFFIDVIFRSTIVRKRVQNLRGDGLNEGRSIFRKNMNVSLPAPLAIAITNLGGSFMLIPCWLFAVLLGAFSITQFYKV